MKEGYIDLGAKHECSMSDNVYYPHLDVKGIDMGDLNDSEEEIEAKVILKKKSYDFDSKECCFEVHAIKIPKMKSDKNSMQVADEAFDAALKEYE